jgi:hypothetical protein
VRLRAAREPVVPAGNPCYTASTAASAGATAGQGSGPPCPSAVSRPPHCPSSPALPLPLPPARSIRAAHCLTSVQFSPCCRHMLLAYGKKHISLLRSLVADRGSVLPLHTILEVFRRGGALGAPLQALWARLHLPPCGVVAQPCGCSPGSFDRATSVCLPAQAHTHTPLPLPLSPPIHPPT